MKNAFIIKIKEYLMAKLVVATQKLLENIKNINIFKYQTKINSTIVNNKDVNTHIKMEFLKENGHISQVSPTVCKLAVCLVLWPYYLNMTVHCEQNS